MKKLMIALIAGLWTMGAAAQDVGASRSGSLMLAEASVEGADNVESNRNSFTSRRGHKNPAYKNQPTDGKWEGATLVVDGEEADNGKVKSNINQISKRPYLKRNVD